MEQTQREKHQEQLNKILEKFEDQFDVELQPTGYEHTAQQNGGIKEAEYWVNNLIEAPQGLNFKVGGWFSMDTRGGEDTEKSVYCMLSVKINNEEVNDTKAIRCRYHHDKEKWGKPRWESF